MDVRMRIRGAAASLGLVLVFSICALPALFPAPLYAQVGTSDCVVKADCPVDKADFFTSAQDPNIPCGGGKGYCYAKSDKVTLSVKIGDIAEITDVGQWVKIVYTYAVGVAAVLAAVMMMIGGIIWLTAADSGRVSRAKGMISDALIGLALTLGAYVILQTVNPDILQLRTPKVKFVKVEPVNKNVVKCLGYSTREDCLADPKHVGGDTKCIWMADIGGPHQCAQQDEVGISGKLCDKGKTCKSGLKCINTAYGGGGGMMDVCTDGKADSPCAKDEDCTGTGLVCHNYRCQTASGRKNGESCDKASQCDSRICVNGPKEYNGCPSGATYGGCPICLPGDESTFCYNVASGSNTRQANSDANCASGYFCPIEDGDQATCTPGLSDGQPCARDRQCQSGSCSIWGHSGFSKQCVPK